MEKFWNGWWLHNDVNVLKGTELYTQKGLKFYHFTTYTTVVMYILSHKKTALLIHFTLL